MSKTSMYLCDLSFFAAFRFLSFHTARVISDIRAVRTDARFCCDQTKPRHEVGALYLRDAALLQRCNHPLVVFLCERPTSLRPYKSEGSGSQGELCDDFVVRCFDNGHGIILARYEVKGF